MHMWLPWLALLPLARAEPPVARGPARLEGQGREAGGLAPLPFGKPVRDAYFQFGEGSRHTLRSALQDARSF